MMPLRHVAIIWFVIFMNNLVIRSVVPKYLAIVCIIFTALSKGGSISMIALGSGAIQGLKESLQSGQVFYVVLGLVGRFGDLNVDFTPL